MGEPRRLIASIHDVSPRSEAAVERLLDLLSSRLGGPHLAMLVVPDHWDEAPIAANPAFARRLRGWADQGVEMFLHGWRHRDDAPDKGFRQRHMTAGEGEFAALDHATATARLLAGRRVVEDAIGRPVNGFVAPAWLYSDAAKAAVRDQGFPLAEDHWRVWRPVDGRVLSEGPVVTWASRSPLRIASSLAVAALARTPLWRWPTVRLAVHPGDVTKASIMASIDATVAHLAATRTVARYGDLCAS